MLTYTDKNKIQTIIDRAEKKIKAGRRICGRTLSCTSKEIMSIWEAAECAIANIKYKAGVF